MSENPQVAVVMGSESDWPLMQAAVQTLRDFEVPFEVRVLSAHRSPRETHEFAAGAEGRGLRVLIAGAGGSAHLAGVLASMTVLPVIGVPVPTSRMGGMDSLLSTVQMPRGVPVATVGIGNSGAQNAALLALQILATGDERLREALREHRASMAEEVQEADGRVRQAAEEDEEP